VLVDSTMRTVRVTAMILTIVACGQMFAAVFVGSGGLESLQTFLKAFSVGKWGLLFLVVFIVFLAGFMLEPLVTILMVVPITMPLIEAAGFDKVWFCVQFLVMLQTGYLTPPMARQSSTCAASPHLRSRCGTCTSEYGDSSPCSCWWFVCSWRSLNVSLGCRMLS
jgi:TRAP-type C4-dicarboxylate transport system permease large subunit